ncbi:hypothetical protein IV203_013909 [Nitzschia inconspicua]|uniref:Uncharacterized protein n=1 Tax=Nitzschia inconspicua TaxID=303405 RepID=A0A9K3M6G8_9STRA|nr:hypothetical protein IV203_013909 [Nitzschia inconspicua]
MSIRFAGKEIEYSLPVQARLIGQSFQPNSLPPHILGISYDFNVTLRRIDEYCESLVDGQQQVTVLEWQKRDSFSPVVEKDVFQQRMTVLKEQQQVLMQKQQSKGKKEKEKELVLARGTIAAKKNGARMGAMWNQSTLVAIEQTPTSHTDPTSKEEDEEDEKEMEVEDTNCDGVSPPQEQFDYSCHSFGQTEGDQTLPCPVISQATSRWTNTENTILNNENWEEILPLLLNRTKRDITQRTMVWERTGKIQEMDLDDEGEEDIEDGTDNEDETMKKVMAAEDNDDHYATNIDEEESIKLSANRPQ